VLDSSLTFTAGTLNATLAVGDSLEDMGVAGQVGRFFLVANAKVAPVGDNVEITEGANGEGFYEAVVRTLAESR